MGVIWIDSGRFAAPALWTPANITTALWLDANDTSTLFDSNTGGNQSVNNGVVGRWVDKSGNTRNVTQSTSDSRPTLITNELNSKNVLNFDGFNDSMAGTVTLGALIPSLNSASWLVVANADTISTNAGQGASYANQAIIGDTQGYYGLGLRSNVANGYSMQSFDTGERIASVSYTAANWGIFEGSLGGGFVRARLNGGTEATTAYSNLGRITGVFTVGRQFTSPVFDGKIAEIVILSSYASQDTRQKLEGYLAHKWGLAANLPADHPYKSAAPTL